MLSAFGVEDSRLSKAYVPGSITFHQEQSNLHARKKSANDRRVRAGLAAAGAGVTGAGVAHVLSPTIAHAVNPGPDSEVRVERVMRTGRAIRRAGTLGGAAVVAGGLGTAGASAIARSRHARKQNLSTRAAQAARKARAADKNWSH